MDGVDLGRSRSGETTALCTQASSSTVPTHRRRVDSHAFGHALDDAFALATRVFQVVVTREPSVWCAIRDLHPFLPWMDRAGALRRLVISSHPLVRSMSLFLDRPSSKSQPPVPVVGVGTFR